jgi:hypothetical protein
VSRTLVLLWSIVVLEIVSPVPAVLTAGAIWVLLARPAWLPRLVRELYGQREPAADPDR